MQHAAAALIHYDRLSQAVLAMSKVAATAVSLVAMEVSVANRRLSVCSARQIDLSTDQQ
jgi:hypothetical protein